MCPPRHEGLTPLCREGPLFSARPGLLLILPAFCRRLLPVLAVLTKWPVVLPAAFRMSLRVLRLPRSMFARWEIPDGVASSWPGDMP